MSTFTRDKPSKTKNAALALLIEVFMLMLSAHVYVLISVFHFSQRMNISPPYAVSTGQQSTVDSWPTAHTYLY